MTGVIDVYPVTLLLAKKGEEGGHGYLGMGRHQGGGPVERLLSSCDDVVKYVPCDE